MGQSTGHAGAIFAAEGSSRHRLVRAAVAGGIALLAAWVIALALGVLGGFGSLPGLPSQSSGGSHEASARTQRKATPNHVDSQREAPVRTVAPSAVSDNSS